jgi:hypothetical protein
MLGYLRPATAGAPDQTPDRCKSARAAPDPLTAEAATALRAKDYDKAVRLLRAAIASHEYDSGASYDPWTLGLLEAGALAHGRQQVEKMLVDRPQMNKNLHASDILGKWTASKFARKVNGSQIIWDSTPTSDPQCDAEHDPPANGRPGKIRVNNLDASKMNCEAAFEKLWAQTVFELHNIDNAEEFLRIEEGARHGKLAEDAFVKAMFVQEWKAAQRTRKWYVEIFLPHAKKYDLCTDPDNWFCYSWASADDEFQRYSNKKQYPWKPYSQHFREIWASGSFGRLLKATAAGINQQ